MKVFLGSLVGAERSVPYIMICLVASHQACIVKNSHLSQLLALLIRRSSVGVGAIPG